MEGTDKFTLANICKEKGGVNAPIALVIYGIFLCLVLLSFITIKNWINLVYQFFKGLFLNYCLKYPFFYWSKKFIL
jgi:hypothetical protein